MTRLIRRRSMSTWIKLAAIVAVATLGFTALAVADGKAAQLRAPGQALPGQVIRVTGQGFAPGQQGNLTFDGGVVRDFAASPDGSFNLSFRVPASPRHDRGRVSAKTFSGGLLATTTLAIVRSDPTGVPSDFPTEAPSDSGGPTASASLPSSSDSPSPSSDPSSSPTADPSGPPASAFDHVYVIFFENQEYGDIVGSKSAPYFNSLVAGYGAPTSFFAETHPSQPDYIAFTSGGTQGVNDNSDHDLGADNLFAQISKAGRSWHVYAQGYPGGCYAGSSSNSVSDGDGKAGGYVRRHNPAISYTSVSSNPAECARITNLASFDPAAADFELIVPNLQNDMHDGSIADGDAFLRAFLPRITSSPSFANSVVFVTFEEGSSSQGGGGRVLTVAAASGSTAAWGSSSYSHYSILRTIEEAWGLPLLGAAASARPISFSPSAGTTSIARSPIATFPAPSASWPAGASASRMSLLTPCPDQASCFFYRVRAAGANGSRVDDDLPSIARFFGVSLDTVLALNPWARLGIRPGQDLRLPPPTR